MNLRFERIIKHSTFSETVKKIEEKEKGRIFCRHGMDHLISVARIAYIISLEENADISKDLIYAASLLHDIGRYEEYENGISHNIAGAQIAGIILSDCGYSDTESEMIKNCVLGHRHDGFDENASELEKLICRADKLSRICFDCDAYSECNWDKEKKNDTLIY